MIKKLSESEPILINKLEDYKMIHLKTCIS